MRAQINSLDKEYESQRQKNINLAKQLNTNTNNVQQLKQRSAISVHDASCTCGEFVPQTSSKKSEHIQVRDNNVNSQQKVDDYFVEPVPRLSFQLDSSLCAVVDQDGRNDDNIQPGSTVKSEAATSDGTGNPLPARLDSKGQVRQKNQNLQNVPKITGVTVIAPPVKNLKNNQRKQVISITTSNGSIQQAPDVLDNLAVKTTRQPASGGIMFSSRRGSPRPTAVYNSDLQQVDEDTSHREITSMDSVMQSLSNISKFQVVQDKDKNTVYLTENASDSRTITPNMQPLMLAGGKLETKQIDKDMSKREMSPSITLPLERHSGITQDIQELANQATSNNQHLQFNQFQRSGKLGTELGSKIYKREDNKSTQPHKYKNIGQVLRQSLSGMDLPPERMEVTGDQLMLEARRDLKVICKDSYGSNFKVDEVEAEDIDSPVKPRKRRGTDRKTVDLEQLKGSFQDSTSGKDSIESSQGEKEAEVEKPDEDSSSESNKNEDETEIMQETEDKVEDQQSPKKKIEGLTEQERMEIKQTLKLVYPGLAIQKLSKRNKSIATTSIPSRREQRNNPWKVSILAEQRTFGSQDSHEKKDDRVVLPSFVNKRMQDPRSVGTTIFSQQVSHRALLELGQCSSSSIPRHSKMPNANRTWIKPSSVGHDGVNGRRVKYQQVVPDDNSSLGQPSYQSRVRQQELPYLEMQAVTIRDDGIDVGVPGHSAMRHKSIYGEPDSNDSYQASSKENETQQSRQVASQGDVTRLTSTLPPFIKQTLQQKSLLMQQAEQGMVLGQKMPFCRRKSVEVKEEPSVAPSSGQQVDMESVTPMSNFSKHGRSSLVSSQRDQPIVQVEVSRKGSIGGASSDETKKMPQTASGVRELQPNLVSSGEVSFEKKNSIEVPACKNIQVLKTTHVPKPFNLSIINTQWGEDGVILSPCKVASSQNSESQLTHMSTDAPHVLRPRMGSRLNQKYQGAKGESPVAWRPNMRTIDEGRPKPVTTAADAEQLQIADEESFNEIPSEPLSGTLYSKKREFNETLGDNNQKNRYSSSATKKEREVGHSESKETKYLNLHSTLTPKKHEKQAAQNSLISINKDLSQLDDNYSDLQSMRKGAENESQLRDERNASNLGSSMPPKWPPTQSMLEKVNQVADADADVAAASNVNEYTDDTFSPKSIVNQRLNHEEEKINTQESENGSPINQQKLNNSNLPLYMKVQVQMQHGSKNGKMKETKNEVDEFDAADDDKNRIETKMHSVISTSLMNSQPSTQRPSKCQNSKNKIVHKDINSATSSSKHFDKIASAEKVILPDQIQVEEEERHAADQTHQFHYDEQRQASKSKNHQAITPRHHTHRIVSPPRVNQQPNLAPLSGYTFNKRNIQEQKQDWHNLQISTKANNALKLQKPQTSYPEARRGLGERLYLGCQELTKHIKDVGVMKEARPNVRFLNRDNIGKMQYRNRNSEDSLDEQSLQELSKIDENGSLNESSIQYQESVERGTHDASINWQEQPSINIKTHLSPLQSTNASQLRMLESVERLQAFKSSAYNKHSIQPYVKSDCKYIMTGTMETLQANLKRSYGFQPSIAGLANSGAQTHRVIQDSATSKFEAAITNFRLKKVPAVRKDGHFVSDVASPNESAYAKRKLLAKQRNQLAMHVQSEIRSKQLEMGYNLASPAARMRSLLLTEQKKRNSLGKPSGNNSAVLYEDISGLKTWRTRI